MHSSDLFLVCLREQGGGAGVQRDPVQRLNSLTEEMHPDNALCRAAFALIRL
jgi:hypothetical protein